MGFRPRVALFGAILVVLTPCFCHGSEDGSRTSGLTGLAKAFAYAADTIDEYKNIFTDLGVLGRFVEAQFLNAQITDLVPTFPIVGLSPSLTKYKMEVCQREDVNKCLYYGNSSNGLPKVLQGTFWQDGVKLDEEVISFAGEWNPALRRLTVTPANPRVWGSHATSSEKAPGLPFYLPSGAAHMNFLATLGSTIDVYYNEDLTVGQLIGKANVLGLFTFTTPVIFANWTMARQPDGSWKRESKSLIFISTPTADYTLRQVVTGEGKPGPYYEKWLKFRDGEPFIYFPDR